MSNKFIKIIMIAILPYIFCFANNYGDSCPNVPLKMDSQRSYMLKKTLYGNIVKNIKVDEDSCQDGEKNITIYVNTPAGDIKKTLYPGNKYFVGNIANEQGILNQPLIESLIIDVYDFKGVICMVAETAKGKQGLFCKDYNILSETKDKGGVDWNKKIKLPESCYSKTVYSKNVISITGRMVECIKTSVHNSLFGDDINAIMTSFSKVQTALKKAVLAAITLYIILFGIKMLGDKDVVLDFKQITYMFLKATVVLYFAVGISPTLFTLGMPIQSGITQYVLPFLSSMMWELANMVYSSISTADYGQGLCYFNPADYKEGYGYYALWDAIDCRFAYYFQAIGANLYNAASDFASPFGIMPIVKGLLAGGYIIECLALLMFIIIFISIMLSFVSIFIICLISLYALAYLSPIFIPMVLFEKTKGYFDGWFKAIFSCALQPMIVIAFSAILIILMDSVVYDGCKFTKEIENKSDIEQVYKFKVANKDDVRCRNSIGVILNKFSDKNYWQTHEGFFFSYKYLNISNFSGFMHNIFYLLVFMVIFYFISGKVTTFASSLTAGIRTGSIAIEPMAFAGYVGSAIKDKLFGKKEADGGGDKKPAEDLKSNGKQGMDRGGAKDFVSKKGSTSNIKK